MLVYGNYDCFVMQMLYVLCYIHPVAVFNAAFCMHCSLLMLVDVYPILLLCVVLSFVVACVLVLRWCECVCCMCVLGLR